MSRKPNKRKTANSNRPELTEQERENAKYDALLQELGAYDSEMTLQEKRDYYGALMASMGEGNHSLSSMIISEPTISHSPVRGVPAVKSDQRQDPISMDESPTIPARDSRHTSCTSLPEISSSPPPLEDSPVPIRPRKLKRYGEKAESVSAIKPQISLGVEKEDSDENFSARTRDTQVTCNSNKKESSCDTAVPEPSAAEVKERLTTLRSMLEKKDSSGEILVLISPKELKNLDIDSIPEPCSSRSLIDPVVQEELQRLREQLQAKEIRLNPETLSYEEHVALISKQKKPLKTVIYRRTADRRFSKAWSSDKDVWEEIESDGPNRANEAKNDQAPKRSAKSTRTQTIPVRPNWDNQLESSDDDFFVVKKARVKVDAKKKTHASRSPLDTEQENCHTENEGCFRTETSEKKPSISQVNQGKNGQRTAYCKKSGEGSKLRLEGEPKTSSVPPPEIARKASGKTASEQNLETSTSTFGAVGGVELDELLGRRNLPKYVRERMLASLIICAYCTKSFLPSNLTEKEEHEKRCLQDASLVSENVLDCITNEVPSTGSQILHGKHCGSDGKESDSRIENMDIEVPNIRTSSPVLAKRSTRTRKLV